MKIRLVKGANLAMERAEAESRGWPQAPLLTKADVDASFKRLLVLLLDPAHGDSIRVGAASHNLFDIAFAHLVAQHLGVARRLDIEMLEGMAEGEARAVRAVLDAPVVLYAPVVDPGDFTAAIAYLVRRLDENTSPDNYLRHSLGKRAGWYEEEARRFRQAAALATEPSGPSRRAQARTGDNTRLALDAPFTNEPDTDFTQASNREWIGAHLESLDELEQVPVVIGGEAHRGIAIARSEDPARPGTPLYAFGCADRVLVDDAVGAARRGLEPWAARSAGERRMVLRRVAHVMAESRGRTIAVMTRDGGKPIAEGDTEVSEAIDFARYYGDAAVRDAHGGIHGEPLGVVVVAGPWNFPYAIPAGGVLAALAAGNTVVLKPAPETVWTAWLLAQHCWAGGVPPSALHFVPCLDDDAGRRLVTHPDVDAVVLTGSYETACMFRRWRPDLRLHAETSGKNAMVITAAADLDLAIRDLVRSAFGHAGQKCSAASLAIVEASVHDDATFRRRLVDAARSLAVGPASDPRTVVGPLVREPDGALKRALTALDAGEQWLLEPHSIDGNPQLWSPGIKAGVAPGSFFHLTECFGPVLGLMRADDLAHAIELQNATDYGLTGGLHSLDPVEIATWCEQVEVGNAYVNRHITGAIVGRQPFGGWKRSAVGPTAKAGGPHYVRSLQRPARLTRDWSDEITSVHETAGLDTEANLFRYRIRCDQDAADETETDSRVEPLRSMREQSISATAHRHGNPAPQLRPSIGALPPPAG